MFDWVLSDPDNDIDESRASNGCRDGIKSKNGL